MKNLILFLFLTCFCLLLGSVIGFWVNVATEKKLPNGFYECKDCGNSFADVERYFRRK